MESGKKREGKVAAFGDWLHRASIPDWLLMSASFLFAGLAAFFGILAGTPEPVIPEAGPSESENLWLWFQAAWLWLLCAVVTAVLAPAFGWFRELKREAEHAAQDQYEEDRLAMFRSAVFGGFTPVANLLSQIAAADVTERTALERAVCERTVDAIPRVLGSRDLDRNRASFYLLSETSLDYVCHGGRNWNVPRPKFEQGTRSGNKVLKLVRDNGTTRIPDVETEPDIKPTTKDSYRCVISCSVSAGKHPLGMLTVDAPDVDELTEDDEKLMKVMARLLGAALYKTGQKVIASETSTTVPANAAGASSESFKEA